MTTQVEEFARTFNRLAGEIKDRYGKPVNAEDLAEYIRDKTGYQVSPASIRYWQKADRMATGDNLHALAYVFGEEIYDAAGYSGFRPKIWTLRALEEEWESLTDEERDRIELIAKRAKNELVAAPMAA